MRNPLHWAEDKYEDKFPDWWWDITAKFFMWRIATFPWYYDWKSNRQHKKNMVEKFGYVPGVGDYVEDCRGKRIRIAEIDPNDPDSIVAHDGAGFSLWHCCSPVTEDTILGDE